MSENSCPKCGSVLNGARPGFCDQCGWDIAKPVSEGESPQLVQAQGKGVSLPEIALSINTNQFYMEGFSGVIHIKSENLTNEPFDIVVIEVEGDIPTKNKSFDFNLAPSGPKERRFQLKEIKSRGPKAVSFKLHATKGDIIFDYRAEVTLHVLERIDDARQILSHTGGLELGSSSEKFNIGGVINIDIKNMIDGGQIKTANDVMREYSHLPAKFNPLDLEFIAQRRVRKSRRLWPYIVSAAVVIIACLAGVEIHKSNVRRNETQENLNRAQTARQAARDNRAEADASFLWKEAEASFRAGDTAQKDGLFEKATGFWETSTEQYLAARNYANGVANVRSAKEKYEAALARYDVDVLKQHGGQPWADVSGAVTFARSAGEDFDSAVQWYQRAAELLPAAWENAKEIQEGLRKKDEQAKDIKRDEGAEIVTYGLEEGIRHLVEELRNNVSGKEKAAFLNRITGADGVRTQFDVVLESKMFLELQVDESIRLVDSITATTERTPLQVTISRNQQGSILILSGVLRDSDKLKKLGKVGVEIDSYVKALLSKTSATKDEVEKNQNLKPDVIELPPLEVTYSITGMHNRMGSWETVGIKTGTSLNSGDCFKINFKANEDCFFYVLLYGSGGIAQCLFPHEKIGLDNNVEGDTVYSLPDGENWYYLDNVTGTETIYLVACYEPMKDLAKVLAKMEQADPDRGLSLSRDVTQEINDIRTRGLESDKYVVNQFRGVSGIAQGPKWDLKHEGKTIQAVTEIVRGVGSVVEVVSFEHK